MTKQIISAPSIGLNQTMLDQDALQLIKTCSNMALLPM